MSLLWIGFGVFEYKPKWKLFAIINGSNVYIGWDLAHESFYISSWSKKTEKKALKNVYSLAMFYVVWPICFNTADEEKLFLFFFMSKRKKNNFNIFFFTQPKKKVTTTINITSLHLHLHKITNKIKILPYLNVNTLGIFFYGKIVFN